MNVEPRQVKTLTGESRTVRGFTVRANMAAAAVATALRRDDFSPETVQLTCWLVRNGAHHTICDGNLKVLAMASTLGEALFAYLNPGNAANGVVVTLANDVAVKETGFIPMRVDFGMPINLQGGDKLYLTVTSIGSEYDATNVDSSASFMGVDWIESAGIELATPRIWTKSVSDGEGTNNYDGGNGVWKTVFINFDKAAQLTANLVLASSNISSSRFNANDQTDELYDKTITGMSVDDAGNVDQSRFLMKLSGGELTHDQKCMLSFQSSNVTGGNNYVVHFLLFQTAAVPSRAATLQSQRIAENAKKLSMAQTR